jgi:uncharacterized protein (DUF1697 family)
MGMLLLPRGASFPGTPGAKEDSRDGFSRRPRRCGPRAGSLAAVSDYTNIALLRGINVGGHRRVPMAELRDIAGALGFGDPVTYIQSGNLVFDTDLDEAATVAALASAFEGRFGFPVPVIVRSAAELAAVAASHPFDGLDLKARFFMVAFLDRAPTVDVPTAIDPDSYLPDRFTVEGREVYLAYPNGSGRSKLNHTLLERRLGVGATVRNWPTVTTLAALATR